VGDFSELKVVRGDVMGNLERSELFEYRAISRRLVIQPTATSGPMVPHVVNP